MITFLTGNIFDSDAQAIVNTVNTQGVMGKGLALQFKERYPENYKLYRRACKEGRVRVGRMFITACGSGMFDDERLIINFPTKKEWRNPSQYSYIEDGLADLRKEIYARRIKSIAIPPLGARNGGLCWGVVRRLITDSLADVDCDIRIYEPDAKIISQMEKEKVKLTPARAMLLVVMADMLAEDEMPSEFAAEKICYFLQRFGGADALRLSFDKGIYGPYSGSVRRVLHAMNGSYIMGVQDYSNHPFDDVWITNDALNAAESFLSGCLSRYMEIARRTCKFLSGCYANFMLELLSTVDFIVQHSKSTLSDQELIATVRKALIGWSGRKHTMFNTYDKIALAISHLRSAGLVPPPC